MYGIDRWALIQSYYQSMLTPTATDNQDIHARHGLRQDIKEIISSTANSEIKFNMVHLLVRLYGRKY